MRLRENFQMHAQNTRAHTHTPHNFSEAVGKSHSRAPTRNNEILMDEGEGIITLVFLFFFPVFLGGFFRGVFEKGRYEKGGRREKDAGDRQQRRVLWIFLGKEERRKKSGWRRKRRDGEE